MYRRGVACKGRGRIMAEALTFDHCAIREAAVRLQTEGDNIIDCIERIRAVIYQLPEIWEADICDNYVDQYLKLEPKMQKMADLIADMAAQMNQVSANC